MPHRSPVSRLIAATTKKHTITIHVGVDVAGLLGGRMTSAEGGSVPNGMGHGEGCLLPSRLRGLGERRELPERAPRPKTDFGVFLRPSQNTHFCNYMTKSEGRQFALASPTPNSGRTCPLVLPRDLRP